MITIYSRSSCSQCQLAKKWMAEHQVAFNEIDIDQHQEVIQRLLDAGFSQLPVITDGVSAFSGFNEQDLAQMAKSEK